MKKPPSPRSAEATIIPSHGQGRLMPPLKPGEALNPGGRPKTLKEVRKLAQKESVDALRALIGAYKRPDGKIDRTADGRVVVAAATQVLTWAYGKPPDYDPATDKPESRVDLSGMSLAERKALLAAMERVQVVPGEDDPGVDDGPSFDASIYSEAPMMIEATVVSESPTTEPSQPVPPKPREPKPPKPKPVKRKPVRRRKRKAAKKPVADQAAPKRGRPRKHPLPDPAEPKRPRGRPRKGTP